MSILGRLFGSQPGPVVEVVPPPGTVVVAADLAATLTAAGVDLAEAVDATLRKALADLNRPGEGLPFWLVREGQRAGEMEEQLRDRVAQRHAGEGDR